MAAITHHIPVRKETTDVAHLVHAVIAKLSLLVGESQSFLSMRGLRNFLSSTDINGLSLYVMGNPDVQNFAPGELFTIELDDREMGQVLAELARRGLVKRHDERMLTIALTKGWVSAASRCPLCFGLHLVQ